MARLDDDNKKLTPTQQRLWDALQSGKPVSTNDLRLIIDENSNGTAVGKASMSTLSFHMCLLRTKVREMGESTIIKEGDFYRKVNYVKESFS